MYIKMPVEGYIVVSYISMALAFEAGISVGKNKVLSKK